MKSRVTINERAWAADVISEINRFAGGRSRVIHSAGGEWGLPSKAGESVLFPDVLLFGDPARRAVLQGWELKMPDTDVTDARLLENAQEKSRRLGLTSFLVWNAVDAVLYRWEKDEWRVFKCWRCQRIRTREDVWQERDSWLDVLNDILNDLDDFFEHGDLSSEKPLPSQLNAVVAAIVSTCQGTLAPHLANTARRSRRWRAEDSVWWRGAKAEYGCPPESHKYSILANVILLHWTHRFLFAHYLRRFASEANRISDIGNEITIKEAERQFAELSARRDFVHVFRSIPGASRLPEAVWNTLLAFNGFLRGVRLPDIGQDLLQDTLQAVCRESQRKAAGQFCTPALLATLLVRLAMDDLTAPVLDPCCGTGTIAREAMALKTRNGMSSESAVQTTWASDRYAMPLQFATLSLTSGAVPFETLRVFQHDATALRTGCPVSFTDASSGKVFCEPLPAFPCIVLNPPFIRFEDWMRDEPSVKDVDAFAVRATGEGLSPKSDYYVPILLHMWRLLSDGGRMGAIFSNAWLAADWSRAFRSTLSKLFSVEVVMTSGTGRWFQNTDVVVNLVILKRRDIPACPDSEEETVFAVTRCPLQQWTPETVDAISDAILQPSGSCQSLVGTHRVTAGELNAFNQAGLEWSACFADLDWFPELVPLLTPLSRLFNVARGERRGWDALFYPPSEAGIEDVYLQPVLISSSQVQSVYTHPDGVAFCCSRDLDELERDGHVGALNWIRKFQHASNTKGVPLVRSLARGKLRWYEMRPDTLADLAVSINPDKRLFFTRLCPRSFVNQRLIRLLVNGSVDVELCHALLCSLVGCFYLEALGFGRGLGVLDLNASRIARQMRMLNPDLVDLKNRKAILSAFNDIGKRSVLAFEKEMEQEDRMLFEYLVARTFNFETALQKIKTAVLDLHRMRSTARTLMK